VRRNPILDRFFEREFRPYRYRPIEFSRRVLEIDPHAGQRLWLLNSTYPENALTTGNQFGKSTTAAIKTPWRAAYQKGWDHAIRQRVAISREPWGGLTIAPTADQSRIVFTKMQRLLHARRAQWLVAEMQLTPFPKITFFNGATVEARSTANDGNHLLGHTLDFINWDEAAREPKFEQIRDDVLRMRLVARAGMLDYTTTGNGRNAYGKYFLRGLPGVENRNPRLYSQAGTSYDNPYLPREIIEAAGRGMSERLRRQNIGGEIVDASGGFFDIESLDAAISKELTRWNKILKLDDQDHIAHCEIYIDHNSDPDLGELVEGTPYHVRYPTHRYVHFWDLAKKRDWVVGRTLDTSGERLKAVEFERFNRVDWNIVYDRIRERHFRYQVSSIDDGPGSTSRTIVDATGIGDVAVDMLADINAEPFIFTKASKGEILASLQSAFALREVEVPEIPVEYDEVKFYQEDDKEIVQDCVMALAGAVFHGRRHQEPFSFEF